VESAGSLNFMGIPIMRMITATTAFKMPLYGISFTLSASSELLTEASLYLKIKACFYLTEVFPVSQSTLFLIFKTWGFCALKNCINPSLQPRSPVMDYRGFLLYSKI
jgi:hypothetical protein